MAVVPPEGARCRLCDEWRAPEDFYLRNEVTGNRWTSCRFCATVLARKRTERIEGRIVIPAPRDRTRDEKTCTGCGQTFPITHFALMNPQTMQRRARCPSCRRADAAAYKAAHHEQIRARDAEYRQANHAALAERQRRWREEHPEAYREIHGQWKANNKDAVNASTHKRRNTLVENGGHWTAAEWAALKAEYDHRCLMCGRQEPEITLTVDHVQPVSKGGSNSIDNLQPLCKSCNSTKHRGIVDLRRR